MQSGIRSDADRRSRVVLWLGLALFGVWLAVALPAALGERTLYLRDVLALHLPLKSFGAEQLQAGRIPVFNPTWALGQPFRGNPNALPLYPGNLLYLALPFWSAFNLHYLLHWLLAFFTMRGLARELGRSREASFLAALTYAGSGWLMSSLTFYNLLTVAAWWPLVITGALRGGRRGLAVGGLACGMALLGGEPWTAAMALVPLVWLATRRHGGLRGLLTTGAIGVLGLILALPQVVATARVLEYTVRGGPGLGIPKVGIYALHPFRLLELWLPFPFGLPGEFGRLGIWRPGSVANDSFFYSLYFGLVGLWLAWYGRRRHRGLVVLAIGGLALAWLGGLAPELAHRLSGGMFRYPEKFLVWLALAAPLLAAAGFDRLMSGDRTSEASGSDEPTTDGPKGRGLLVVATVAAGLGLLLAAVAPVLVPAVRERLEVSGTAPDVVERSVAWIQSHLVLGLAGLGIAALILAAMTIGIRRRSPGLLLVLQVVCLAQLFPLLRTLPVAPLVEPSPWLDRVGPGARALHGMGANPAWADPPEYRLPRRNLAAVGPVRASELDLPYGIAHGLEYPLAPDFEGLYSPVHRSLVTMVPKRPWPERVTWLRALGVEWLVMPTAEEPEGLVREDVTNRFGAEIGLYRVPEPRPRAWWPDGIRVEAQPPAAFEAVSRSSPGIAVVPGPVEHVPGARVELEAAGPDRWVIRVDGQGGLLVLQRSYHPLLEAWSGPVALATMPADFALLGVQVPPGSHRVVVDVSDRPEWLATAVALPAFLVLVVVGWRR